MYQSKITIAYFQTGPVISRNKILNIWHQNLKKIKTVENYKKNIDEGDEISENFMFLFTIQYYKSDEQCPNFNCI